MHRPGQVLVNRALHLLKTVSAMPQLRVVALPRKLLDVTTDASLGVIVLERGLLLVWIENKGQVKTYVNGYFWLYDVYFFFWLWFKMTHWPSFLNGVC